MSESQPNHTTITIYPETLQRFNDAKPYNTVSSDEFMQELLDEYESQD